MYCRDRWARVVGAHSLRNTLHQPWCSRVHLLSILDDPTDYGLRSIRTITVVYKGALLWLLQSPGELEALEAKSPRQFVTRGHEGGQHRRPFLFPNILSSATPPHCHKAKIVRNRRLTETSTAQIRGTKCTVLSFCFQRPELACHVAVPSTSATDAITQLHHDHTICQPWRGSEGIILIALVPQIAAKSGHFGNFSCAQESILVSQSVNLERKAMAPESFVTPLSHSVN